MGKQRQNWSAETKLLIVLTALQQHTSIAELSREYGVHENVIHRWKSQFLEHGKQAFQGGNSRSSDAKLKAENARLKKLLGEKTLEVDILKKLSSL